MNSIDRPFINSTRTPRQNIEYEISLLVNEYRARCLWFASPDYQPVNDDERLRALSYIERHGDRKAFMRARELREWLLQNFN